MGGLIGLVVVIVMVFGGYVAAGGKLGIVLEALPFEMMIIGGAAVGAFVIANDGATIRQVIADIPDVFRGGRWRRQDYSDLLCLMFELIRAGRRNPIELETHIETPGESEIFARYPRIRDDAVATDMICDTLRAATMNYDDPHQVEDALDKQLDARLERARHASHALQVTADGLPALGIVAAVLGVIKTMAAIDQPPEILGRMIAGALVGTFLGVFLSYTMVGPFAARLRQIVDADHMFYRLIRDVMVANLHNHAVDLCVEVGRQNTPHALRPSFDELDEALRAAPSEPAAGAAA